MAISLLRTKLHIPPTRPSLVMRPRLIRQLEEGLCAKRKLTLVSAPAGFGKTTLLTTWIHSKRNETSSPPVAWLSLDAGDDQDTWRFWTYILNSLYSASPSMGTIALGMLQATPPAAIETILTAVINEIATHTHQIVLVLDDYQFIHTPEIHNALAFLLDHAPPQMHLILVTRIDPPLNLARLRVRNQMTELRTKDLRFTLEESAMFLNDVMNIGLSPADIGALETRTEGWIAGLQVAAMAMRDQADVSGFVTAFTGSHRHVLSYLVEEVFAQQPPFVQSFLLQTSVLDQFNGSLCDALTERNDSQEILERLERTNLFVVALDDEQRWYRYHHLFRDMLCVRRQRTYTMADAELYHRRASKWYEMNGSVYEAVHHALIIHDFQRVVDLIDLPADEMLGIYDLTTVLYWLNALPDDLVRASPNLSMAYAWAFLASSQPGQVEDRLQDVERALGLAADGSAESLTSPPDLRCVLAKVSSIRANLAFHRSDLPAVLAHCRQALRYLDDPIQDELPHEYAVLQGLITFNMALAHEFHGNVRLAAEQFQQSVHFNRRVENRHLIPMATSHLAQVLCVQGKLHQAADTYRRAIRYTTRSGMPPSPLSGIAHVGLGTILYEFNESARAHDSLVRGVELAQKWNHWEALTSGYLGRSRLEAAQGDWENAHQLLRDLRDLLPELQAPWGQALIDAHQTWLWLRQGNSNAVRIWMQRTDLDADSEIVYLRERELLILARGFIALKMLPQATELLQRLCRAAEQGERTGRLIECLSLLALARQAQHRQQAALPHLQRALALAEPEGYVRLFVDEGQAMKTLLLRIRSSATRLSEYAADLLSAFPRTLPDDTHAQTTSGHRQALIETLSARELELLRCIAAGMTNQGIADTLLVSINTVKSHARHIYGKLGASNRTEAATKARELGLI
jgi:ATP/maltotriose-dependent transcriptional regulator MalT